MLGHTLFHREFARRCEHLLADANAREAYFAPLRARTPTMDLTIVTENFVPLLTLVESHPDNRMAFDYLIAWCLLDEQVFPMLPDYLRHLKEAGYTSLPAHVQEALLTYEKWKRRAVELPGVGFDPKTKTRFSAFEAKMTRASSRQLALRELGPRLRGTFMYYYVFHLPHNDVNYGSLFWCLGCEFQTLGMDDEALAHYRNATWLLPADAETHQSLAELLKKRGELEEANAEYAEARKLDEPLKVPPGKTAQDASERVE
jgi:tetratricopeptide (TPR) repeat protein